MSSGLSFTSSSTLSSKSSSPILIIVALVVVAALMPLPSALLVGSESPAEPEPVCAVRDGIAVGTMASIEKAMIEIDAHGAEFGPRISADLLCAAAAGVQNGATDAVHADTFVLGVFIRPSFRALPQKHQLTCVRSLLSNEGIAARATADARRDAFHAKLAWELVRWLAQVEQAIDPTFDLEKLPQMSVSPPEETGLPSGIEPAAIADEKLRARYIADIAKADAYNTAYKAQLEQGRTFTQAKIKVVEFVKHVELDDKTSRELSRRATREAKLSEKTTKEIFPPSP